MTKLINFLLEVKPDVNGRMLSDILAFTDIQLEFDHQYIQWLFPLETMSQNVYESPILTEKEKEVIKESEIICRNINRALKRMACFYLNNNHWLSEHNHNHLRITRILIATQSLLGQIEAERFYKIIMKRITEMEAVVSPENIAYWDKSLRFKKR